MLNALGNFLTSVKTGFPFADSDAATYAAALEGDGVSLSDDQKQAIDTFYTTGKSQGWYSSLARVYLPIWQQASANSRCLVSGTQGTFNGSIGHNAGYIDNPTYSGLMDTGDSISAKGLSAGNRGFGFLQVAVDSQASKYPMGAADFVNSVGHWSQQGGSNEFLFRYNHNQTPFVQSAGNSTGVRIYASIEVSGDTYLDDRTASGFNNVAFSSGGAALGVSPLVNDYLMALNLYFASDNPFGHWGGRMGAAFYHSSSDSSFNQNFTLALKNLWETCTGLSLT